MSTSALRRVLAPLKSAATRSRYLVISPDPREWKGYQRNNTPVDAQEFHLTVGRNLEPDELQNSFDHNPSYGVASNLSPGVMNQIVSGRQKGSKKFEWFNIVVSDTKLPDGRYPREVLSELLQAFPSHEWRSEKEAEEVVDGIEKRLRDVMISVESGEV